MHETMQKVLAMRLRKKVDFHEAIREARSKKGWTKWRLAKALGVDWHTVNAWEKGRRTPSFLSTIRLIRLFPELLELLEGGEADGEERKDR